MKTSGHRPLAALTTPLNFQRRENINIQKEKMSDTQSQINDVVKSVRTTLVGAIEKNEQINQVFTKAEETTKVGKEMGTWIRCCGHDVILKTLIIARLCWPCMNILYHIVSRRSITRINAMTLKLHIT